jgi:hypothetical protein
MSSTMHRKHITRIDDAEVEELRASVAGPVLRDGDDGYEAVRAVWNGMIQLRPGVIVRCAGTADVIAALTFAQTTTWRSRSAAAATTSREVVVR